MADSERFNPNHVPGGAGGGQFTSGSGGSGGKAPAAKGKAPAKAPAAKAAHAKGHAHPALPDTPNGLGYSAQQWRQLQQWEADYKAGKKLDHHQLHMLHEAHLKHVAALGRKIAVAGTGAHHLHAQREAHKAHAARLAREAALAKAKGRSAEPDGDDRAAGAVTNPKGTERLHEYWVHGEGAAKIAWGTPGDFGRCVTELGKYIHDPQGYCNLAHHAALGYYPATHAKMDKAGRSATMASKPYGDVEYADPANGKYPIDTAKHAQAAWNYINQPGNAGQYTPEQLAEVKKRIMAACQKFGIDTDGDMNSAHFAPDVDVVRSGGGLELQPGEDGSLGTLTGRFSEFGRWYPVSSRLEGNFLERVAPGSTLDTIRDNRDSMRVLFDHGMDGLIGNKVLGPIKVLEERSDGPYYEVPLFDTSYNRDLLPGLKAGVYGASMRMRVTGDEWNDEPKRSADNPDGVPERTITRMKVLEFGPVTFPANPGASAGVRSATDEFYGRLAEVNPPAFADAVRACGLSIDDFTGRVTARSGPGRERDVRPGNGAASPITQTALRDRAWRMREVR